MNHQPTDTRFPQADLSFGFCKLNSPLNVSSMSAGGRGPWISDANIGKIALYYKTFNGFRSGSPEF